MSNVLYLRINDVKPQGKRVRRVMQPKIPLAWGWPLDGGPLFLISGVLVMKIAPFYSWP
jgi:hypothetical protein